MAWSGNAGLTFGYPWSLIVEEHAPKPAKPNLTIHAAAIFIVLAFCCRFYLHLAESQTLGLFTGTQPASYHSRLAEAFRHGQLSLLELPKPELLALKDPYLPELNAPYRMHDASLYRGKYYLYFGPTPALVLHLPMRVLMGTYPSDATSVLLFLTAGLAAWLAVFYSAIRAWFPGLNPLWTLLGGLAIGFCSTGPFVLARPAVYEVSLASAYCFTALCFLSLMGAFIAGPSRVNLAAAGVALSLAIGSRPPALLIAPIVVAALMWRFRRERMPWKSQVRQLAPFAIPLALAGTLLAVYNFLRFDNPLQFGNAYQLADINVRKVRFFDFGRVPGALHYYVTSGHRATLEFPFVRPLREKVEEMRELVAGGLPLYPFLAALVALPALLRRGVGAKPDLRLMLTVLTAAGVAHLLLLCCFLGITMRYELEFVPPLTTAAVLAICVAAQSGSRWRWALIVLAPALLAGALQGCLLGFGGYYDYYEQSHAGSTAFMQARLLGIENGLARIFGGYGGVGLRLKKREGAPNLVQLLVSTGIDETETSVVMRYLDSETVRLGCAAYGRETVYGQPLRLTGGSPHTIEAYIGSMYPDSRVIYASWFAPETYQTAHGRCLVRVDGISVTDIRSFATEGSAPWRVKVHQSGPGLILSSRRILAPPPQF